MTAGTATGADELRRDSLAVFVASFSVLLLQLALTRILSVAFHYHLSFLVVSLAMLGLGASGVVAGLRPIRPSELGERLAAGSLAFAVTAVGATAVVFHARIGLEHTSGTGPLLAAVCALLVLPFLAGGSVVALVLTHASAHANRLYAFDLVGAALACVVFVPAASLGPPTTVLAVAALMAAAGAVQAAPGGRLRLASAVCAGALAVAAVANPWLELYDIRVSKGRPRGDAVFRGWNAFSRVEVVGTPGSIETPRPPVSYGYSKTLDPGFRVAEAWIRYDADALTQITRLDGEPADLVHLAHDVTSAAYQMRAFSPVLVIGAGGGRDVLTALSLGSGPITGVEVNPLTLELMRGPFRDYSGGLYSGYPGVDVVHAEGRNFVRQSPGRYDLIQVSLVDTWAASAAGAHALAENSLYTVEAFGDFLSHLTPRGVVSFSRWYGEPPVEPLRLVNVAREALVRQGARDPGAHLFVVRTRPPYAGGPSMCTVLTGRSPLESDLLERLVAWSEAMGFLVEFSPGGGAGPAFHALLGPDAAEFVAGYGYDVRAVTDDMPFFFDRVPLLPWLLHRFGLRESRVGESLLTAGGQTLLASLVFSALGTLVLALLPAFVSGAEPGRLPSSRGRVATWLAYFACLGVGFINVELVLLGRLNLFLGYPIYALVVVLFALLLFSGLGSALAGRIRSERGWPRAVAGIVVVLSLASWALPALIARGLGAPTPTRIGLAVLALAPIGLALGAAFPLGIRRASLEGSGLVPWAWAVNGGTSVFGSSLTVVLSMSFGFAASFRVGIAAYVVAAVLAFVLSRQREFARGHEP